MKMRSALVVATMLGSSLAFGQMGPGPGHGPGLGGMRALGIRPGKVVANLPYSATISNTVTRVLADGNTLQRTTTGTVWRDSSGRTATTETIAGMFGQSGSRTVTFIYDPIAGFAYTLNPDTKTAIRRALKTQPGASSNSVGPWGQNRATNKAANPNIVTEDKGSQVVNGVNAQGKVVTNTIPAGAVGNAKPIVATTETWFSPDLQIVISSTRTDPRVGTMNYALTNIQRAEPSASLFQVPSDYAIKDAPAFGGLR